MIGGGGFGVNPNKVTGAFGTVAGGVKNSAADRAAVAGGSSNTASGIRSAIGGGYNNLASGQLATVGGGSYNAATANSATVGGGISNDATGGASTVAGGENNLADAIDCTVGGGTGNHAGTWMSTVGGGAGNQATHSFCTVGGGYYNEATGYESTIAGGDRNWAHGSYSTVAGGAPLNNDVPPTLNNRATGIFSTIGGGGNNRAEGEGATICGGSSNAATGAYTAVGGGWLNTAGGDYSVIGGGGGDPNDGQSGAITKNRTFKKYCVVAGGMNNQAGLDDAEPLDGAWAAVSGGYGNVADGWTAAIGGGYDNHASGIDSTIGGGQSNHASGNNATVPGGYYCSANGIDSFAAGCQAVAQGNGTFAWADYAGGTFTVSTANEFAARATGGVYFYTNTALTAGSYLAAGSSTWANVSDREAKRNFSAVDGTQVLDKLASMPISTWSYKSEKDTIRHMGPMAQDMHAAFGLGDSDKSITTIDGDGVALAAIQGLNKKLDDQNRKQGTEIAALRGEIETLKTMIRQMAQK